MGTMTHLSAGLSFDGVTLTHNGKVLIDLREACWIGATHLERWQAVNRVWDRIVDAWEKSLD